MTKSKRARQRIRAIQNKIVQGTNDKPIKLKEPNEKIENKNNIGSTVLQENNNGNKKRTREYEIETKEQSTNEDKESTYEIKNGTVTIYIPSILTSKEAKKFRKDARRKLSRSNPEIDKLTIRFLPQEKEEPVKKRIKRSFPRINDLIAETNTNKKPTKNKNENSISHMTEEDKSKYVAMDCEMVGIGPNGHKSALARVSIVDFSGNVILDYHAQVPVPVTNFRTAISGIKPSDIHVKNPNALPLDILRTKVTNILSNKILIGHAVHNDLKVLMLPHPSRDIRDTSKFQPFRKNVNGRFIARKLKDLARMELGMIIQEEGMPHDSVQDAIAAMELYKSRRYEWEKDVQTKLRQRRKK